MGYTNNSNHFRIDESELLYMSLGEYWAVSFQGYKHQWDNEKTLGPARGKPEWSGARLGIIKEYWNSNEWHSPRYDFEEYNHYFDNSIGDYPFQPVSDEYWKKANKYMLWESDAWKTNRTIGNDWWSSKVQMEESVWKQLTDPYRIKWGDEVRPCDFIKKHGLTQDDLNLEKIYLYKEFETKAELNEAHKALQIKEYESCIDRLQKLPYGVSR